MFIKAIKVILTLPLIALLSVVVGCVVLLGGIARLGGSGAPGVDLERLISRGSS